jgi:hypothetical protein
LFSGDSAAAIAVMAMSTAVVLPSRSIMLQTPFPFPLSRASSNAKPAGMKMISVVSACCREQPGGSSSRNTANEEGQYNVARR